MVIIVTIFLSFIQNEARLGWSKRDLSGCESHRCDRYFRVALIDGISEHKGKIFLLG